jgi:cobalt transporter subunit CbtB
MTAAQGGSDSNKALGWRAVEDTVTTHQTSTAPAASPSVTSAIGSGRLMPIAFAALLGVVLVGGVGFSHIDVVHNAAHDYRHSMGFPCH